MSTLTGWPFWAPSDLASVEDALDLAGAAAGDTVVDLGCGDGQVLVAAARRGCRVIGVECDAELVERSREALEQNELAGEVIEGDVFEFDLAGCDVIFTYLAPATLQRLTDRFRRASGARLVTVDFAVPDLVVDAAEGQNHLYRLPGRRTRSRRSFGWSAGGVAVGVTPDRHSLTCLSAIHPGGTAAVEVTGDLRGLVALAVGADSYDRGRPVAVDLRWEELDGGTFAAGSIADGSLGDLPVFALVTDTEDGLWELEGDAVDRLHALVRTGWAPTSFAELLTACEG